MIQPRSVTASEILTLSNNFIVPKFQRDYSWKKSEASEFLGDLQSEAARGLFLGTLIFDVSDENNKRITIIDGQQRLTTILLLLIACRERAKAIGAKEIANMTQQRITFVNAATGQSLGPLLIASESIKDVFDHVSSYSWDGTFLPRIDGKPVKRQVNRVKPVFDLFSHAISGHDQGLLSALLDAIYKVRVIRIDVEGEEEAFSIFERTNARGVRLRGFGSSEELFLSTGSNGTR
jgi:uncharacterized protein with ParB-like and HNH nuclease domain